MSYEEVLNKNVLIVVESPFQLLCAYEAIHSLKLNYKLIVRLSGHINNDQQLKQMADNLSFSNVIFIKIKTKKDVLSLLNMTIFYIQLYFRQFDYYYFGDYLSGFLKLSSKFINRKKIFLLDDGVATLKIQQQFLQNNSPLNLYTVFDIKAMHMQKILKHRFLHLTNHFKNSNIINKNIYIGENLVELSILDAKKYLDIVREVAKESKELFYFPHRLSSPDILNEIKKIKNISIVYPDVCIEYYVLKEGILPSKVYSILSTALFTLNILFPKSNIIAYKPIFNVTKRSEDIEHLFNIMKLDTSISVIEYK